MKPIWQEEVLQTLVTTFQNKEAIQCILLKGSCADPKIIDAWSDIDLLIFVKDESIDEVYQNHDWMSPLGIIFAIDQFESSTAKVIRVCFENRIRLDVSFFNASILEDLSSLEKGLFEGNIKVLFSNIHSLDNIIDSAPKSESFITCSDEKVESMANQFRFLAVIALSKLIRGDYLIAGHLALEMAQNCIVLQMLERDKQKGTSVHRTGNCEFLAIVDTFKSDSPKTQPLRILQLIQDSCLQFDELASSYSPQYQTRSAAVIPWIEEVRLELTKRIG